MLVPGSLGKSILVHLSIDNHYCILLYVFKSEYKVQGSHLVKVTGEFLGIVCIFTIFSSFGSKRHYSSIKDQSHIINIQYALFRFFQIICYIICMQWVTWCNNWRLLLCTTIVSTFRVRGQRLSLMKGIFHISENLFSSLTI